MLPVRDGTDAADHMSLSRPAGGLVKGLRRSWLRTAGGPSYPRFCLRFNARSGRAIHDCRVCGVFFIKEVRLSFSGLKQTEALITVGIYVANGWLCPMSSGVSR